MFSLKYVVKGESNEMLFTLKERATALAIAREKFDKGQRPRLTERAYDSPLVRVLFDYRNVEKKRKPGQRKAA